MALRASLFFLKALTAWPLNTADWATFGVVSPAIRWKTANAPKRALNRAGATRASRSSMKNRDPQFAPL
eukprot:6424045-Lingulodinium_polyedra.AAC.1